MSYNVAEYIIGCVLMACMMVKKMAGLSQTVCVRSTNEAFKPTNTLTQTHTRTHRRMPQVRMQCVTFRLKIRL